MTSRFKAAVLGVTLVVSLWRVPVLEAEQPKQAPPAPIPAQILAAKKVFVANAGGDQPLGDDGQFSGGARRPYNQFYAALKALGRFELVSAPADADLLFEIQFTVRPLAGPVVRGDTLGGRKYDPQFRLIIRDPKTNALLWAFTEHAEWAILQGNRDKNFDFALAKIVTDVQALSLASPSPIPDDHQ